MIYEKQLLFWKLFLFCVPVSSIFWSFLNEGREKQIWMLIKTITAGEVFCPVLFAVGYFLSTDAQYPTHRFHHGSLIIEWYWVTCCLLFYHAVKVWVKKISYYISICKIITTVWIRTVSIHSIAQSYFCQVDMTYTVRHFTDASLILTFTPVGGFCGVFF